MSSHLPALLQGLMIFRAMRGGFALLGAGLALVLSCAGAQTVKGLRPSWLTLAVVLAVALASVYTAAVSRTNARLRSFAGGFGAVLLALGGFAAISAFNVARSAKELAAGQPYCIQIANRGADYEQARAVFDLSPLTMMATYNGDRAMQNHAVLAIGAGLHPRALHWSHRSRKWVEDTATAKRSVISCRPKVNFVRELPVAVLLTRPDQTRDLRIGPRRFSIPADYQPQASLSSAANLILRARAPDFAPAPEHSDRLVSSVLIYFAPGPMMSWLVGDGQVLEDALGPEGRVAARVSCGAGICHHIFLHDDTLYTFRYEDTLLPQWRETQYRMIALLRSFRASEN